MKETNWIGGESTYSWLKLETLAHQNAKKYQNL